MNKKVLVISLAAVAIAIAAAAILVWAYMGGYWPFGGQKIQESSALKNVEKMSYAVKAPFDPEDFKEIEEATPEIEKIFSELKVDETEVVIPANTRVRLTLKTFCLDPDTGAPGASTPTIFSYEKTDMPLFSELVNYMLAHPEVEQCLFQDLIWHLSSDEQYKFYHLSEEEQQILLKISPSAEEIVDSYQYYRNTSIKNYVFDKNLPEETVAQQFPGTELYIKIRDTRSFDYAEVDVYNPTAKSQTLPLIKEGEGFLTFVPQGMIKKVRMGELAFRVTAGKFDISDNIFRTPADAGAVLWSEDGKKKIIEPGSELSQAELAKILEQSDDLSFFRSFRAQAATQDNWSDLPPELQRKLGGNPDVPGGEKDDFCFHICCGCGVRG